MGDWRWLLRVVQSGDPARSAGADRLGHRDPGHPEEPGECQPEARNGTSCLRSGRGGARDLLLKGTPLPDRDLFFGYEPKLGTAMRRGKWKMIVKGEDVQLFDLEGDLKETTNITSESPAVTTSMREAIERFRETVVPGS